MKKEITPKECMTKCQEAAELISKKGLDAATIVITDNKGPFVWKNTYVFVMDLKGMMLAHPKSELIGLNLLLMRDGNDTLLFQEMISIAKNGGEGWVEYLWPKPGEEKASQKRSYILRVAGKNIFVGAGIYQGYQFKLEPLITSRDLTWLDFCQWEFPIQKLSNFHVVM